jgi:hypothetical protein
MPLNLHQAIINSIDKSLLPLLIGQDVNLDLCIEKRMRRKS